MCLAGFAAQDVDLNVMQIIIVDHKSLVPLRVSREWQHLDITLVRLETGAGPGAARKHGASLATGQVLVFVDVDVIPNASMVRHYASGPLGAPHVVSLGFRQFIDPELVDEQEVSSAIESGLLHEYLDERPAAEGQEWIEQYLARTNDLREWRDDLWIVVVGAGLGVSRSMYDFAGGFQGYPEHGIEDTEFGYRLYQAGAVIKPVREALGYHIGLRSISQRRELINRRRAGWLANLIPHPRYRPYTRGRQWSVPKVVCQVQISDGSTLEMAQSTVDDLLAQSETDVSIVVWGSRIQELDLLSFEYSSDSRVDLRGLEGDMRPGIPLAAPLTLRVQAGVRFTGEAVQHLTARLNEENRSLIAVVHESDDVTVELWRTCALARLEFMGAKDQARQLANMSESWVGATQFGVGYDTGVGDRKNSGGRYVRAGA